MKKEARKFDFKALMAHEPKTKIIVTEKNKPNFDLMAKAFYDLFYKRNRGI